MAPVALVPLEGPVALFGPVGQIEWVLLTLGTVRIVAAPALELAVVVGAAVALGALGEARFALIARQRLVTDPQFVYSRLRQTKHSTKLQPLLHAA
jgi:hypothetical protein